MIWQPTSLMFANTSVAEFNIRRSHAIAWPNRRRRPDARSVLLLAGNGRVSRKSPPIARRAVRLGQRRGKAASSVGPAARRPG
ncbi:hypothetical protein ACFSAA_09460 [Sphingomonas qilianensis]